VPPSPWSPLPRPPPPGRHYPGAPLPHLLDPALPPRPAPPPCLPALPLLLLVAAADGTGAGAPATARYPRLRGHLRGHAAPAASTARYPRPLGPGRPFRAAMDPFAFWEGQDGDSVDGSDASDEDAGDGEGDRAGTALDDSGVGAFNDVPSRRAFQRRLMTPLPPEGGEEERQTWLLVGPVSGANDVNPQDFGFTAHIVAHSRYSAREVFARAIPRLVKARDVPFRNEAATYESLRFLARCQPLADETGVEEPSWRDFPIGGGGGPLSLFGAKGGVTGPRAAASRGGGGVAEGGGPPALARPLQKKRVWKSRRGETFPLGGGGSTCRLLSASGW